MITAGLKIRADVFQHLTALYFVPHLRIQRLCRRMAACVLFGFYRTRHGIDLDQRAVHIGTAIQFDFCVIVVLHAVNPDTPTAAIEDNANRIFCFPLPLNLWKRRLQIGGNPMVYVSDQGFFHIRIRLRVNDLTLQSLLPLFPAHLRQEKRDGQPQCPYHNDTKQQPVLPRSTDHSKHGDYRADHDRDTCPQCLVGLHFRSSFPLCLKNKKGTAPVFGNSPQNMVRSLCAGMLFRQRLPLTVDHAFPAWRGCFGGCGFRRCRRFLFACPVWLAPANGPAILIDDF